MFDASTATPKLRDVYWLGAHKTGTTSLQHTLSLANAALVQGGYGCPTMEHIRRAYTRPLLYHGHGSTPAAPLPKTPQIIFDENILALVQDALSPFALYPDGAERARRVWDHLGRATPDLVLGIRNFATYLPSLYCETLKSTPYRPFHAFNNTALHALSWADLAERLLAAFPGARLRVYRAEDLPNNEAVVLGWVTGLGADVFPQVTTSVRAGFSGLALRALARIAADRTVTFDDVARAVANHPRGPDAPAFDPWQAQQRADLNMMYALDCDALAAMDRVDFWHPTP